MDDLIQYEIFKKHQSTLKDTSKDDRDADNVSYLTESAFPAINFDRVKDEYCNPLGISQTPCSCDALFQKDGIICILEFKAGQMSKRKIREVEKKIYDTLLIFSDIVPLTLKDLRQKAVFILAYNEEINPMEQEQESGKEKIQESPSLNRLQKGIAKLGKTEIIRFGFDKFKKYCFKEVHTFTIDELEMFVCT